MDHYYGQTNDTHVNHTACTQRKVDAPYPSPPQPTQVEWSSIDGKLNQFSREAAGEITDEHPAFTGAYEGYLTDAGELITRLGQRGFKIVPMD